VTFGKGERICIDRLLFYADVVLSQTGNHDCRAGNRGVDLIRAEITLGEIARPSSLQYLATKHHARPEKEQSTDAWMKMQWYHLHTK
jgi:hypothetical protein